MVASAPTNLSRYRPMEKTGPPALPLSLFGPRAIPPLATAVTSGVAATPLCTE